MATAVVDGEISANPCHISGAGVSRGVKSDQARHA